MIRQPFLLACVLFATVARAQSPLYTFSGVGDAVAGAGDVDSDGVSDLLVARAGTLGKLGRVELHSGATGALLLARDAAGLDDGFGSAIAGARDLDLDGRPDFVVGAPAAIGVPEVHAFSSVTGLPLWSKPGALGSRFGSAVALGGDLDGDGRGDVLVGAPDGGALSEGEVSVFSGATGALVRSHAGVGGATGEFGAAVLFLGDLDRDGGADYAVGDPKTLTGHPWPSGSVVVYSGSTGAVLYSLPGVSAGDYFGRGLADAGDIDGDGRDELVVGSPGGVMVAQAAGTVFLFSGASGNLLHTTPAQPGTWGFGTSVAGLGDYDADGVRDYAGHYPMTGGGDVFKNFGTVRVLSGASGLDIGSVTFGQYGPIATPGDVNGDSIPDLLIGGALLGAGQVGSMLYAGASSAPVVYCTAKMSSKGCVPISAGSHGIGASFGQGVTVTASSVPTGRNAILFWSPPGPIKPFAGGWLCVASFPHSTGVQSSGGSVGDCDGFLSYTFTPSFAAQHAFTTGQTIYTQFWIRDDGPTVMKSRDLSAGVSFRYWP